MKKRLKSFTCALCGAWVLLKTQPNARIHAMATVIVLAAAAFFRLSPLDWALICAAIGMVWAAEAFNTAIEFLADEVTLEIREKIGYLKDVAAFGVLCAAITAAIIGGIVFGPRIAACF